jgi:biopolymer transport protein ExbD
MSRRRRRRIRSEGPKLNMAAMLDMAFQLLAFFIATFKPMTIEQQIALKLPPPEKIMGPDSPSQQKKDANIDVLLKSVQIGVSAAPDGSLASISFIDEGGARVGGLNDFQAKLRKKLEAKDSPIEQVILEIDPRLQLQNAMEVMDRCLQLKMSDGKPLTKISPVLARTGGAAPK